MIQRKPHFDEARQNEPGALRILLLLARAASPSDASLGTEVDTVFY